MDIEKIFDSVEVAINVADANCRVIYANERCKKIFKEVFGLEDFVGKNLSECHKPETMKRIKVLFKEFKDKQRTLDYHTTEIPDGRVTIVHVPFYDGDQLAGVTEFTFESALD